MKHCSECNDCAKECPSKSGGKLYWLGGPHNCEKHIKPEPMKTWLGLIAIDRNPQGLHDTLLSCGLEI